MSGVTFWEEQFFWRRKRFFLCSFPTFCWIFSKFRIHFGHLGKRFRNCREVALHCSELKSCQVKTFAGVSMFIKLSAVGQKNSEILWRKVFRTVVNLAFWFFKRTVWQRNRFVNFSIRTKKNKKIVFRYWLKTTPNACQPTTDILYRTCFGRISGWKVSQKAKQWNTECLSKKH